MNTEPLGGGYVARSRAFFAQAQDDLSKGWSAMASEALWAATYQMLKAIAVSRKWPYNSYHQLFEALLKLVEETQDDEYTVLFHAAAGLHVNSREDWEPRPVVESMVPQVEKFLDKVEALVAKSAEHLQEPVATAP